MNLDTRVNNWVFKGQWTRLLSSWAHKIQSSQFIIQGPLKLLIQISVSPTADKLLRHRAVIVNNLSRQILINNWCKISNTFREANIESEPSQYSPLIMEIFSSSKKKLYPANYRCENSWSRLLIPLRSTKKRERERKNHLRRWEQFGVGGGYKEPISVSRETFRVTSANPISRFVTSAGFLLPSLFLSWVLSTHFYSRRLLFFFSGREDFWGAI